MRIRIELEVFALVFLLLPANIVLFLIFAYHADVGVKDIRSHLIFNTLNNL